MWATEAFGYGLPAFADGNVWSAVVGSFFATSPWTYLVILPLALAVCGYAEYRYGAKKMLLSMVIAQLGAVVGVALFLLLGSALGFVWATDLAALRDVGLSNALLGVAGALTAGFSPLWRVRSRLALLLISFSMLLYAAYIWDFTHFVSLGIGLVLGPWLVGRPIEQPKWNVTPTTIRAFSASMVLFWTISGVIDVLYPDNGSLFHYGVSTDLAIRPVTLIVFFVALSGLIAYGLYRARRNAWKVASVYWALALATSFLSHFSAEMIFDVAIATLALVVLVRYAGFFAVRPDKTANRLKWRWVVSIGVAVFIIHVIVLWLLMDTFTRGSLGDAFLITLLQSLAIPVDSHHLGHTVIQTALSGMMIVWFTCALLSIGAIMLSTRRPAEQPDLNDYRTLLTEYRSYSLSWMGTWPHMRQWLTPSKSMAVSYRLIGDVAIVLGNPIGVHQSAPWALKQFSAYCGSQG